MQEAASRWNNLKDGEKKPFFDLSEKDRQRYDEELKSLLTKGYFINGKGEKSTDLKPKVAKETRAKNVELPLKREAPSDGQPATKKLKKE